MSTVETYVERAAQSREEAAGATLANVRDRSLRSALAWETLAEQLRVTEVYQGANEVARKTILAASSFETQTYAPLWVESGH
jgi:hypothetical protein